jgi:transposase-like protein
MKYKDYPIDEVVAQVDQRIEQAGGFAYQKWTCQHCGSRQTMETKNVFHRSGRCEECDGITVIAKCNYIFIMGLRS